MYTTNELLDAAKKNIETANKVIEILTNCTYEQDEYGHEWIEYKGRKCSIWYYEFEEGLQINWYDKHL